MKKILLSLSIIISCLSFSSATAQTTVRIDATKTHQRITGFGGFVCSPSFGYGHMTESEIKKVWGSTSTLGCNIMRLYIPIGRNYWSQSLNTAKLAEQMGLIVFASPWGQPAEWKTNNSSDAVNSNNERGSLKKENWGDYAEYLNDYVKYLRDNGVELDAISIQNEPDMDCKYAGCMWTPAEIAEFVKTYGAGISCPVIAPESVGASDYYANALNSADVLAGFDIYGGHQYGGIGSSYKNLAAKGKEIWMTEYLINWNENQPTSRNFDFSKDFFNFFRAINTCMLGDFNAWIHYASKRYYAMLGDGQNGTSNGTITKRGYIMAHFAKHVTGMTRVDADLSAAGLEGSAYLSQTGDTVVVVMANDATSSVEMTLDLPFYTQSGKFYCTTSSYNKRLTTLTLDAETCRPVVNVPSNSVSTVLFVKSRERQVSNMTGTKTCFDRIDDMITTKTGFGTKYKLSGATATIDHSNPLISANTSSTNGYVALDDRYSRLVFNVKKVSSTMNYNSSKTTLRFINSKGVTSTHDYGVVDVSRKDDFSMIFDLTPAAMPNGCKGLMSLTNDNWSSILTFTFGDVYLDNGFGATYAATLSGAYVEDDGNVLDYTSDARCTSIDMTACTDVPSEYPWLQGTNRVVWLPENSMATAANIIQNGTCSNLVLTADGGTFRPASAFQAEQAAFTTQMDECRLLMLPFAAAVPQGVTAYSIADDQTLTQIDAIPAHTPVLVVADESGTVVFSGEGEVSFAKSPIADKLRGTYTPVQLFAGDYVLAQQDGQWGFQRVESQSVLNPFDVYATINSQESFIPLELPADGIMQTVGEVKKNDSAIYDLQGRPVVSKQLRPGIYISNGIKILK